MLAPGVPRYGNGARAGDEAHFVMLAIPAVDLRDGVCVQFVGGAYEQERLRPGDPLGIARAWEQYGFRQLHVVDLDAALGRGANSDVVRDILDERTMTVQVGGGVRSGDTIERLLSDGAARVVVGTRALASPEWLAEMASLFPDELVVAAEVRDRRVATHGQERVPPRHVMDVIDELNALPLAALLLNVHRVGQQGTDLPLMEDMAEASVFPVYAAGGVATMNDLRALSDRGLSGVIVGTALYSGALDPYAVAEEFGGEA